MTDSVKPTDDTGHELDAFLGVQPGHPYRVWIIRGGIGAAILAVLLSLSRCFTADQSPQYATSEVVRSNLAVTVSATGNLQPTNEVEIGSQQSGLITDVYVDVNDRVTKGQVLAVVDTERLQDTINQNRANVNAAESGLVQAEATAALARANLSRLEQVYRLSGGKVPSRVELDTGRAEHARAQAGVAASQAQVSQARALLATSETDLRRARIYSPVNGVVLSRSIEPGQTVAASFQAPVLFSIAEDLTQMELKVQVDEADVGQVKQGQKASFAVDAFPGRSFPAYIRRVNVGANSSTSSSSSSSSTSSSATSASAVVAYTAILSVNNRDMTLRPGMTATAEIVTEEQKNVLLVPNAALRFSPEGAQAGGGKGGVTSMLMPGRPRGSRSEEAVKIGRGSEQTIYVYTESGALEAIKVRTGNSDGSQTVVTSDKLKPGMKVVTSRLSSETGK